MKIIWTLFGAIREDQLDWFLANSGTKQIKQKDGSMEWVIDGTQKIQAQRIAKSTTRSYRHGDTIYIEILKASNLEYNLRKAKEQTISQMGTKGGYNLSTYNLIDLLVKKEVEIEYEYHGEKFTYKVSLTPTKYKYQKKENINY